MAYGGHNSGLFNRAIITSASAFGVPLGTQAANQVLYNQIASSAGCLYAEEGSLQCLRDGKFLSV
jgi:hypothetical protein